jgi:hypothetical protein
VLGQPRRSGHMTLSNFFLFSFPRSRLFPPFFPFSFSFHDAPSSHPCFLFMEKPPTGRIITRCFEEKSPPPPSPYSTYSIFRPPSVLPHSWRRTWGSYYDHGVHSMYSVLRRLVATKNISIMPSPSLGLSADYLPCPWNPDGDLNRVQVHSATHDRVSTQEAY